MKHEDSRVYIVEFEGRRWRVEASNRHGALRRAAAEQPTYTRTRMKMRPRKQFNIWEAEDEV